MQSVTKRVYAIDFSLAILGYILFVCMDTIAKDLVERYHVAQIIFVSGISALLPVLLYTQARNSWNKISILYGIRLCFWVAFPGDVLDDRINSSRLLHSGFSIQWTLCTFHLSDSEELAPFNCSTGSIHID